MSRQSSIFSGLLESPDAKEPHADFSNLHSKQSTIYITLHCLMTNNAHVEHIPDSTLVSEMKAVARCVVAKASNTYGYT